MKQKEIEKFKGKKTRLILENNFRVIGRILETYDDYFTYESMTGKKSLVANKYVLMIVEMGDF